MRRLVVLLLTVLLPHENSCSAAAASGGGIQCSRRCGSTTVPYPFGFSPGCPIPLSCDASISTPILGRSGTTIHSFNSTTSTIVVSLPPSCTRSVPDAKKALSGANYGVSSHTGLFLRGGCREINASGAECSVPASVMSRLLRTAQCVGNDTSVTCFASSPMNSTAVAAPAPAPAPALKSAYPNQFLRWEKVEAFRCGDALTAALYGDTDTVLSLEFGVAELGWWVNGTCAGSGELCAANATCTDVDTPSGKKGHRCACQAGMNGDGFLAGDGCHYLAKRGFKKNVAFIAAGVVVGVAAAAGVLLLLCWARRRRSVGKGRQGSSRLAAMRLLSEAATSSGVPVYSYNEVARATNSFSDTHRLGTGAYGTVYVGRLPANSTALVAIKRLRCRLDDHDDGGGRAVALLLNEIRLISSLSHPNLVRLLGCCLDRGEQILVYELVPNGTLSHHLHGNGDGDSTLPWRARLGVAAGTAAAIAYLHAARPPIFHRDVKSGNILLGADLRAKLADFGLSRAARGAEDASRSHVSTAPQGTPGYVDPEYHQSFHLSDKSDVYSFGVVLLELITAMKVVDFARPANEVNLACLALDRIGKGRVEEIVDPALLRHGEEWVMESVRHVSELAFQCLAFDKDVRPSMSEVAAELCRIRDAAPDSGMTDLVADVGLNGPDTTTAKKARSPVSVQEVWVSDRSSQSTNGSMPRFP
ncbi:wall-associated receptor kinase-like 21 isoform X4 [Triticum urartu]|uniref:wall-associated receptor kinase-like 21 isoform X4 n=1 Tax=Triticum urartu TaxID=4572 RepID=UPI002042D2F9|nr:wall-associated receptor kinase-like 21 isoform X4 [Triticum urartu]